MAEGASGDPRLTTWILNSSGMLSADQSIYAGVHAPVLIVLGGPDDVAYTNGMNDFENINNVPIVVASTPMGHAGTYNQDNGGSFAQPDVAWLNWWLKGDEGPTGKGVLVGTGCTFCSDNAWEVMSENLP